MEANGANVRHMGYVTKDMYHAILKLMLLKEVKEKKTYSYEMLKPMAAKLAGFTSKPDIKNDVYNTISSLEAAGFIRSHTVRDGSRVKKYYRMTDKGEKALKEMRLIFKSALKEASVLLR